MMTGSLQDDLTVITMGAFVLFMAIFWCRLRSQHRDVFGDRRRRTSSERASDGAGTWGQGHDTGDDGGDGGGDGGD